MNPLMFLPMATALAEELIKQGHLAAERREQAIKDMVAHMHTIKFPTLASDYEAARDALLGDKPPDEAA